MSVGYLIGAGASAKTLPVVEAIPDRLEKAIKDLGVRNDLDDLKTRPRPDTNFRKARNGLIEEFRRLLIETRGPVGRPVSVDTVARKYFLREDKQRFDWIKRVISLFFLYEEATHAYIPDRRYDNFLATLLSPGGPQRVHFPPQLKILSWNYDSQIEIAVRRFFTDSAIDVRDVQAIVNPLPRVPGVTTVDEADIKDRFCLIRVNGSAGISQVPTDPQTGTRFWDYVWDHYDHGATDQNRLMGVLRLYDAFFGQEDPIYEPLVNFAWDDNAYAKDALKIAEQVCSEFGQLVVIGYSFPPFNRRVDRRLLDAMTNLRKVYIQVERRHIADVQTRLRALYAGSAEMTPVESVDQFYIPPEL